MGRIFAFQELNSFHTANPSDNANSWQAHILQWGKLGQGKRPQADSSLPKVTYLLKLFNQLDQNGDTLPTFKYQENLVTFLIQLRMKIFLFNECNETMRSHWLKNVVFIKMALSYRQSCFCFCLSITIAHLLLAPKYLSSLPVNISIRQGSSSVQLQIS